MFLKLVVQLELIRNLVNFSESSVVSAWKDVPLNSSDLHRTLFACQVVTKKNNQKNQLRIEAQRDKQIRAQSQKEQQHQIQIHRIRCQLKRKL